MTETNTVPSISFQEVDIGDILAVPEFPKSRFDKKSSDSSFKAQQIHMAAKIVAAVAADELARKELLSGYPLSASLIAIKTAPNKKIQHLIWSIHNLSKSLASKGRIRESEFTLKIANGLRHNVLHMQASRFIPAMETALSIYRSRSPS